MTLMGGEGGGERVIEVCKRSRPPRLDGNRRRSDWLVKDGAINYNTTYKVEAAKMEWNGVA